MLRIHQLGLVPYLATMHAMQQFTQERTANTPDELWVCQHPSIYSQGLAGQASHLLNTAHIPVVQSNRGGQVTYHGPGQVIAYPLLDLKRLGLFVKAYVALLEQCVLETLAVWGIMGHRVPKAPGIYVCLAKPLMYQDKSFLNAQVAQANTPVASSFSGLAKIAALGIKVSHHCTYHGLSLNVAMDLTPFAGIHACGYPGLQTIDMASLGVAVSTQAVADRLATILAVNLESKAQLRVEG